MKNELIMLLRICAHYIRNNGESRGSSTRLLRIINRENHITQKELQNKVGIKSGSISEILIKLEAKGFIIRTQSERDKRQMDLFLTPKGTVELENSENLRKNMEEKMFSSLTNEEEEQLIKLLKKLTESWETI